VTLEARADRIAADRDRGASELLRDLLPLLAEAIAGGGAAPREVARIVCAGQPAMAPLWNACAAALADRDRPGRFARVRAEMERAAPALMRSASATLAELAPTGRDAVVITLSFSGSVAQTIGAIARTRPLQVVCAEGRPRFEGRRMAETLAGSGARVTLTTDAAIATYLSAEAVVVVGADAIAADGWINKVGTLGVAAAASLRGTPLYVIASRDKALARPLRDRWRSPAAAPDEIWSAPVAGVTCENRYFERIPSELATLFLTDAGPISPSDLPQVSERYLDDIAVLISAL
jgi:translation initiation factor eIF-2B subunit delta/ribose 1,5-bisphosphate isomerase